MLLKYYLALIGQKALHFLKYLRVWAGIVFPDIRQKIWERAYRFTRMLLYGTGIYINNRGARSAAQFSFFILMTIFPLLICVHWFIGMLNESSSKLLHSLYGVIPSAVLDFISDYIDYISANNSKTILVAGLIMLVTPSAAAYRSLRGILCDIRMRREHNGVLIFILSFFVSIVMLAIIYLSMVLMFTGNRLLRFLIDYFHLSDSIMGWNWLRFLLLFVLISFMLYLMYRFGHIDPMEPRDVLAGYAYPGALIGSLLIVGVSIIYSWFISLSTRYSLVYGSLASIIIMMLWLYTCSSIIICGGIFNRIIDEHDRLVKRFHVPKDVHAAADNARRTLKSAINSGSGGDSSSDTKSE